MRPAINGTVTPVRPALGAVVGARAGEGLPTALLQPIQALAAFMATLPPGERPAMFARRGVTIIENFPPYVFVGQDAVARWEQGFRTSAANRALTGLSAEFGPAQDFGEAGSRAFFVLPTTWTGRAGGKPFEERGAWSFVLLRTTADWKILGYGWGVTSLRARSR